MSVSLESILERSLDHYAWTSTIPVDVRARVISDADRKAAWELYIELVTRVATQPLEDEDGVEVTALDSVVSLFRFARELMRRAGPEAVVLAAFTLALLNGRIRPFTARWHKSSAEGRLSDPAIAGRFRDDLRALQNDLRPAADALAAMANINPLTDYRAPSP